MLTYDKPTPVINVTQQQLECVRCGAQTHATCNCGTYYRPKAERAAEAVAAHPEKSNRAIAEDIGVDEKTVRQARSGADYSAPEVTGRDGKSYPAIKPKRPIYEPPGPERQDVIDQIKALFKPLSPSDKRYCAEQLQELYWNR